MVHRLNRMLIAVAIAAFGVAIMGAVATAQTCIIVNGVKVYVDDNTYQAGNTNGSVEFESPNPIPLQGPLNESLTLISLNANSNSPDIGAVTTTSIQGSATIVSQGADRFPADVNIQFSGTVTVQGTVYPTPATGISLTGTVNSFPFSNEQFVVSNDVILGSGVTLKAGSSVNVNGQP